MVLQDFWSGGVRPLNLRHFLQGDSLGKPTFWIGDLGDDPQDREDPRQIPPQGGPPSGGNATILGHGGTMGLPTSGRSNGDGGARVGGDICTPPP